MDVRRYEELLFCITLSRAAHTSCIRYSSTGLHKYCFQSHVTPLDDALLPFSIRAPSHKLTEEEEEEVLGERERRRWWWRERERETNEKTVARPGLAPSRSPSTAPHTTSSSLPAFSKAPKFAKNHDNSYFATE